MQKNFIVEIKKIFPNKWIPIGPDDIILRIRVIDETGRECEFEYLDWYRHFLSAIERAIVGDVPKLTLKGCNFSLQWINGRDVRLSLEDEEKRCSVELSFTNFVNEIRKMTDQIVEIMDKRTMEVSELKGREEFTDLCKDAFGKYEKWKKGNRTLSETYR
jgi:hypothetical protein